MIKLGKGPLPTDRERELALEVGRAFDATSGRAALLTEMAKAFARYRVELHKTARPTRQSRESANRSTKGR